jgi:hypothetical protein
MAVVAHHGGSYEIVAHCPNQKQLWLLGQLAGNVGMRIIPWTRQTALFPEAHNRRLIVGFKGPYSHFSTGQG